MFSGPVIILWSHSWVTAQICFLTHKVVHIQGCFYVMAKYVAVKQEVFPDSRMRFCWNKSYCVCGSNIKSSRFWGYVQGGKTADGVGSVCLYMEIPLLQVSSRPSHLTVVHLCSAGLSLVFSYHSYRVMVLEKWCLTSSWGAVLQQRAIKCPNAAHRVQSSPPQPWRREVTLCSTGRHSLSFWYS